MNVAFQVRLEKPMPMQNIEEALIMPLVQGHSLGCESILPPLQEGGGKVATAAHNLPSKSPPG